MLAVVAVAGAIFGWFSMKRAQEAEAQAEQTRLMAEAARGEAEKLVVYLLDDFHLELAPVGRLDIVGELAKRALDYYNALPPALRTPQTERNRALALVRYGSVLRTQARLADGQQGDRRGRAGPGHDARRGRPVGDDGDRPRAGAEHAGAPRVERRTTTRPRSRSAPGRSRRSARWRRRRTPRSRLRRAYGEVLNMHGFLLMRNRQREPAIAALDEARAAFRAHRRPRD